MKTGWVAVNCRATAHANDRSGRQLISKTKVEPAAKRRKRRKEGKSSSDEAARAADLTYPTQRVLLDLELWGAEIDQPAVLKAMMADRQAEREL